jgi:hypothetical protein
LAQFSPATGKNKIKQDQEQQKAFLDYVTTTKISASVRKQNNNNNNQTKPKRISFGFRYRAFQLCISLSRTCTSQIFSGFTFFVFVLFSISHVIFFLSPGQQTKRMEVCGTVCYVVVAVVGCPPSSKIPAAKL